MGKLTRLTGKVFAGEADLEDLGVFGSAKAGQGVNPTATDTEAQIQAGTAYGEGWTSAVVSNKNFPPVEEVNGVLRTISYQNCYLLQEGIPAYDSDTEYSNTSIVKALNNNGIVFYRSLQDGNIGNSLSDTDYWEVVEFPYNNYNFDGQWTYKKQLLSSTVTSGTYTLSLTTYLGVPSGNTTQYEILFAHTYHAGISQTRKGIIYSDVISDYFTGSGNDGYGSMATTDQGRTTSYLGTIPVKTKLYMDLKGNFTTNELIAIGYRRLGTNV